MRIKSNHVCSYVYPLWLTLVMLLTAITAAAENLNDSLDSPTATYQSGLQLVGTKGKTHPLSEYLVSEKFDGVRGRWDGTKMWTRSGHPISLPVWFTLGFPAEPLDGELWIQRQGFEAISSLVRDSDANPERWRAVKFMVFDYPAISLPFGERYAKALKRYSELSEFLEVIKQTRLESQEALDSALAALVAQGGEGLMLHHESARYRAGRNSDLVKVKSYQDAEAKVLAHLPGKGKYQGMMGALLVETREGIRFKIGSGFSDALRRQPPVIGSTITYKYYGYTSKGVPRFASFLRIREPL